MKIFALFLALCSAAFAANGITLGTVTVDSTFECLSVTQAFTGDDNANATVVIQYKLTSGSTWITAYTPFIDRRATINGHANPHANEARLSIVGLSEATAYDVRLTWTDADGITGTNPGTGSATTLTSTPPLGGTDRYVDSAAAGGGNGTIGTPYNTIAAAVSAASAGDTIYMKGTFGTTSISKSGTSSAWIKFAKWPAQTLTIGGGNRSIDFSGAYVWFSGFHVAANGLAPVSNQQYGVYISTTSHHVFCDTLIFDGVGGSGGTYANNYGTAGVGCDTGSYHVYAKNCTFITANSATDYNSSYVFGFSLAGATNQLGTFIVSDCTFSGNWRDEISSEGGAWGDGYVYNCDIDRNLIQTGNFDDGIEVDGENRHLRVWDNTISTATGSSGISLTPSLIGPAYVFRNYINLTDGAQATKMGSGWGGPVYFFHNTFKTTGFSVWNSPDGFSDTGAPYSTLLTSRNNVIISDRYCIYRGGSTNDYDYDVLNSLSYLNIVNEYNPATTNDNYPTLASFQSGASQELHGIGSTIVLNSNGTLVSGSLAANAGLALPNFNGPNTPWPYVTARPSIGAFELNQTVSVSGLSGKFLLLGPVQIK